MVAQAGIHIDERALRRDIARARRTLRRLGERAIPIAEAQALNKTGAKARTSARRELARVKQVPQKVLKRRLALFKASRRRLEARLWLGLKRGISAEELGGGAFFFAGKHAGTLKVGRRVFRDVFKATMPSGRAGLFARRTPSTRKSRGAWSDNLPIEQPQVRLDPEAQPILRRHAAEHMRKTLPLELRRALQNQIRKLTR